MEQPNEWDLACVNAKMEGLDRMYLAAVNAYRTGFVEAMVMFARRFVPGVASIRLEADVDWRWTFSAWLDADGHEIDVDFGRQIDDMLLDVFDSSRLSELADLESGTGYIHLSGWNEGVVGRNLADWQEHQRLHARP